MCHVVSWIGALFKAKKYIVPRGECCVKKRKVFVWVELFV